MTLYIEKELPLEVNNPEYDEKYRYRFDCNRLADAFCSKFCAQTKQEARFQH